ncbi:hypothetical protein KI688_006877 [Linnemannia hyalina]|uniref:Uncharacterized protein n=1 Tax=Linnemannia hyalina TaxID=64524 RepID=A0A9P7XIW3_9FUNG|nr:hypothetical protein KI688_006877 [Linnemannia hyalina]
MIGRRLFAPSVFYFAAIAVILVLQVSPLVQSAPVAIHSPSTGREQVVVKPLGSSAAEG